MNQRTRPENIVRTAMLSIWGLITLTLVFTVSLLIYEMFQQGQTPLALTLGSNDLPPVVTKTPIQTRISHEIPIYFASKTTSTLSPELHRLQLTPSTVENCRTAISYLIDGPYLPALAPILSNKTRIRAMYLMENGELIVDFSRDLEAGHIKSASAEMLMVDGVVKTLVQLALKGQNDLSVKSVRFLFEGSAYQQSFPTHIDLTDPVRPRQSVPASAGNATNDA
ncbi:MAG TPA: hypothetical protein EYN96_11675 [Candidatus Hydrogenedentes bacterium]|jgi:hypothetical protein|nr:hypothetical protein [Candidatus Hydrogenedentota bacterium]HIB01464.1 hypothetical protein [Phycisphaerales bacterium]HIB54966.1 hypothetical protein [Nitrospirales bacterium]HIO21286.1 hypothetical protein [Nitrospirales bacterium]